MSFTDQEKSRIKHHLKYPNWESLSQSIQLGFPSGSQPLFLLEDAFERIAISSEATVRADLAQCECIEQQVIASRTRFSTTKVGEVHINLREIDMLEAQLGRWTRTLANDLGVVIDPYALQTYAGGVNSRVVG